MDRSGLSSGGDDSSGKEVVREGSKETNHPELE